MYIASYITTPSLNPLQKRTRPRRLINTCTIELEEFPSDDSVPPYAILSHRWEEGQEISYEKMVKCQSGLTTWQSIRSKSGYKKIIAACRQAREDNHTYIWIDTCCINKGDHGQQSQDINSMFDYYRNSEVCYVYLYDFYDGARSLGESSWFSRGWTLQELIAPLSVEFFDAKWKRCGDRKTLCSSLSYITGIGVDILRFGYGCYTVRVGIAERMSWAIDRQTTKDEDRAYCLLGVLDVTMEPRYGEGVESAFERLSKVLHESDRLRGEYIPKTGPDLIDRVSYRTRRVRLLEGPRTGNPKNSQEDIGSMSSGYWGKHWWRRLKLPSRSNV